MSDMFDWNGDGKLDHWEEANKALFIYNQTHSHSVEDHPSSNSEKENSDSGVGLVIVLFLVFYIVIRVLFI